MMGGVKGQPRNKITQAQVLKIVQDCAKRGERFKLRDAAAILGVTFQTVRWHIQNAERAGLLVRRGAKLYTKNGKALVLDQRGRASKSAAVLKSEGGKKGAAIHKERARKCGVEWNAFARVPARGEDEINQRIEAIVARVKAQEAQRVDDGLHIRVRVSNARKVG